MNWTEAHVLFAKTGFDDNKTYGLIATELNAHFDENTTWKSVRSRLARHHPKAMLERIQSEKIWREARREDIRRMDSLGFSARAIAEAHDMDLSYVYEIIEQEGGRDRATLTRSAQIQKRMTEVLGPSWARDMALRPDLEPDLVDGGTLLIDLEHDDCRWPIGRDADGAYRFCGCPRIKDMHHKRSYCEAHTADARRGTQKSSVTIFPKYKLYGVRDTRDNPLEEAA